MRTILISRCDHRLDAPRDVDGASLRSMRGPARDDETEPQRLDRNWGELLQELRVAQTAVQILTAFLLTAPFSAAFDELTQTQRIVYVVVLQCSMTSAILLLTPVALHRQLFRRGRRPWLVETANHLARAGLVLFGAANTGAVWLVVDIVLGGWTAWVLAASTGVLMLTLWLAVPLGLRHRHPGSD